jgi:hypothetical protein
MNHLGARAFDEIGGEVVQTTTFIVRNIYSANYRGTYARLVSPTTEDGKRLLYLSKDQFYYVSQDSLYMIPGMPLAYWASESLKKGFFVNFSKNGNFSDFGFLPIF